MSDEAIKDMSGLKPGAVLAGKYRIERVLGRGGMGLVVAAHHVDLGEDVAIKFLLEGGQTDREAVSRFLREARAAVRIKSEHVVRVSDFGTLESGSPYLVMEYLDGVDLADLLQRDGALSVDQAVEFVLQASEALAEAHVLGFVHRDLKPANMFVVRRRDGVNSIKVLDFGISKGGAAAGSFVTNSIAVMGTPLYMSPEQLRSSRDVDARSDIWALGVILYELLTGSCPFVAEALPQLVMRIIADPPAPLSDKRPDVPEALDRVIRKCLEKERACRFENVAELAAALLPFAAERGRASIIKIASILRQPHESRDADLVQPVLGFAKTEKAVPARITPIRQPNSDSESEADPSVKRTELAGAATLAEAQHASSGGSVAPSTVTRPATPKRRKGGALVVGLAIAALAIGGAATFIRPPHACSGTDVSDCRKQCERGDGKSCARLASIYENGTGVAKDSARALALEQQACDAKALGSCVQLGNRYESGEGVSKDVAQAAYLYKRACDGALAEGCASLASLFERGLGEAKDLTRAAALYKQACELGVINACARLGALFERGAGVEKDTPRAAALYKQACDGNLGDACTNLGALYQNGLGLAKDVQHAARLYKQGCDAGSSNGCDALGLLMEKGVGIARDVAKSTALYKQACDGNSANGCLDYGSAFAEGSGVEKDLPRATTLIQRGIPFYDRDCGEGSGVDSCSPREIANFAVLYEAGQFGVEKDVTKATSLLERSCQAGFAGGCCALGAKYLTGSGVTKDVPKALSVLEKACDTGDAGCCSNLGSIYGGHTYEPIPGVKRDLDRADAFYKRSCDGENFDGGAADGCFSLALAYEFRKKDFVQAEALYKKACDGGAAEGCASLGRLYENGAGRIAVNHNQAIVFYNQACSEHVQTACDGLRRLGVAP